MLSFINNLSFELSSVLLRFIAKMLKIPVGAVVGEVVGIVVGAAVGDVVGVSYECKFLVGIKK